MPSPRDPREKCKKSDNEITAAASCIAVSNNRQDGVVSLGGQHILRSMEVSCGVAEKQLTSVLVHAWAYFFREVAPPAALVHRSTTRYKIEQLNILDNQVKLERIVEAIRAAEAAGYPAVISVSADDSGGLKTAFITYPGLDGKPVVEMLCFGATTGKSGADGASMLRSALKELGIVPAQVGHAWAQNVH